MKDNPGDKNHGTRDKQRSIIAKLKKIKIFEDELRYKVAYREV